MRIIKIEIINKNKWTKKNENNKNEIKNEIKNEN